VAKEARLLPQDKEIPWAAWCKFIQGFHDVADVEVTERYHFGELRLARLNFYSKVFFSGWNYFEIYTQYGWYFARFMPLYLFVFGSISIVLAAMQTALTTDSQSAYKQSAYGFSTFSIWLTGIGLALFPLLLPFLSVSRIRVRCIA
jgi:hypothetical protein